MIVLGGGLKRREKLSARLGDILSLMYLASAVLKRYENEGRQQSDAPLMHWAIWDAMFKAQNAFEGVLANFPNRAVAWLLRRVIFPLGRPYVVPADALGAQVAQKLIAPSPTRERLTHGMYVPAGDDDIVGAIEIALDATISAEPIEQRLRHAQKDGRIHGRDQAELLAAARAAGIMGNGEGDILARRDALRDRVIRVDHFPQDFGVEQVQ
jgi:acyl-CoA dehydrogenase